MKLENSVRNYIDATLHGNDEKIQKCASWLLIDFINVIGKEASKEFRCANAVDKILMAIRHKC